MNNTTTPSTRFAGFDYDATELSAYIFSIDTFIISLKNQQIVRYTTTEPDDFQQWLEHHGVRNINEQIGRMVYDYYFPGRK